METNTRASVDALRGIDLVNRELLKALISSRPDRLALLDHVLANMQQIRDGLLATTQPEATIQGVDLAVGYWQRQRDAWAAGTQVS